MNSEIQDTKKGNGYKEGKQNYNGIEIENIYK